MCRCLSGGQMNSTISLSQRSIKDLCKTRLSRSFEATRSHFGWAWKNLNLRSLRQTPRCQISRILTTTCSKRWNIWPNTTKLSRDTKPSSFGINSSNGLDKKGSTQSECLSLRQSDQKACRINSSDSLNPTNELMVMALKQSRTPKFMKLCNQPAKICPQTRKMS